MSQMVKSDILDDSIASSFVLFCFTSLATMKIRLMSLVEHFAHSILT